MKAALDGKKHTQGHTRRWGKQHSTMRKPGIPPARIPEITWRKPKGITTHSWSLRSKQRQRRVATRVVKRKVKRTVKPELMWEKQMWNGQWNSPAGALRVRSVVLFDHHTLGQFLVLSYCGACWIGTVPKTSDFLLPEWGSGERYPTRTSLMAPSLRLR